MTETFLWTTREIVTPETARKITEALQAIDPDADFTRFFQAGNETHGWITRPNDGTNDHNERRSQNKRLIETAERIIAGARKHSRQVVTWQSPRGNKFSICQNCARAHVPNPRDSVGQEFCTVSHGLHKGDCDHAD